MIQQHTIGKTATTVSSENGETTVRLGNYGNYNVEARGYAGSIGQYKTLTDLCTDLDLDTETVECELMGDPVNDPDADGYSIFKISDPEDGGSLYIKIK